MKSIIIILAMSVMSAFADNKDLTEAEVIKILKKEFPHSGNIFVKYHEKTDDWSFNLNSPDQCKGCGDGVIKDTKQNPKIELWREG